MTIDEAIEVYKHPTKHCSSEHREADKIAIQSMEELKELREMRDTIESNANALEQNGYNKAIDDFCAEIEKEYDNDSCPNVSDYLDYKISLRDLFNIAEQLKEGGAE